MPRDLRPRLSTRLTSRWLITGLSCLLVLSACTATSTIETAETPAGPSQVDSEPANNDEASETDVEPAPSSDAEESDTGAADQAGDTTDEPDTASADTADGDPLFDLQGELPLTNEDVNGLIEFIEQDSGRPFLRPPVIVAQTTDDFIAGLTADLGDFEAESEFDIRQLQSLGLTTKGVSEVSNLFVELLTSPQGVLGYYDPEADELYVPIDALAGDDFRSLLVHELTHALDGQYTDLTILERLVDEAEITGDYEPIAALQAVVEGRATSIQNRWMARNNVVESVPDDLGVAAEVPPALLLSLSIPYVFGSIFIDAEGGAEGTWDLLDDPPDSSEEFLVLGSAGQEIVTVPVPNADGPVLEETVFGASDLLVWMLGESLEPDPQLIFPTLTAIDGWAGGQSVMWGNDSETCTRVAFAADSPGDLSEIQELLEDWASRRDGRSTLIEADLVTATGCAPYVP